MAYEGMTAFFLEAGFLGIMLFGWNRVPRIVHFLSTCLVAFGANLSAFWIMAANSWMQTPTGYELVDGKFMVTSFWEAIFNPSLPFHLSHMLMASYETAAFAVAGISAFYLLRKKHVHFYRYSMGLALGIAALIAPLQAFLGDMEGLRVARYQPAKLAAIEAHWETNTEGGAPFVALAIPDMKGERNHFEVAIPNMLSLLITHSWDGKVLGLKEFPPEDRPNSFIVFWSFRLMAAIGFFYIFVMIWAGILWRKKRLFACRPFLLTLIAIQPLGFVATEAGWVVSEVGRQPWVVYGLLRTAEGASLIPAGNVVWSLGILMIIFALIGSSYFYYVLKTLNRGPDLTSPIPPIHLPAGVRYLSDTEPTTEDQ
jgi:cytochrome d ubiquinol oxidase subunit I